jgi:hypothetical protein
VKKFTEKIKEIKCGNGLEKRKPRGWKTATRDIKHDTRSKNTMRIGLDDGTLWMPHASPKRNRNQ